MLDQTHSQCSTPGGSRMETLYGTERFTVTLWHLMPQDALRFEENSRSQWLVVCGQVEADDNQAPSRVMAVGSYFQNPRGIENGSDEPADLLEVNWQENATPRPLSEITETRPWGSFTVLKDEPAFKLKQLMVKPGNRLSLQRHQKREEHWLITAGKPDITLNESILSMTARHYIHIPTQAWHRITNPAETGENVEIIELQLGEYFGEDDIERREDDYGRC